MYFADLGQPQVGLRERVLDHILTNEKRGLIIQKLEARAGTDIFFHFLDFKFRATNENEIIPSCKINGGIL